MDEVPPFFEEFKRAMFRRDVDALAPLVTDEFVWELHSGLVEGNPAGRVLHGPAEMIAEMERRHREWTDVRYDDVDERMAGDDLIVQTFVVSGVDSRGERFSSRAVDLYPLRDGKIAAKQTYWKQPAPGPAV